MALTPHEIERNFGLIVTAALKGERCPKNWPLGILNSAALQPLARAGRIRIEIAGKNFRQVTILKGEHAGKKTAPSTQNGVVYLIIGETTTRPTREVRLSEAVTKLQPVARGQAAAERAAQPLIPYAGSARRKIAP